jgi:hypothetical protein
MAELKPKHDDALAGQPKNAGTVPQPSTETKPHGDKLKNAFENASKPAQQKSH